LPDESNCFGEIALTCHRQATVHGVVFEILVGSENRVGRLARFADDYRRRAVSGSGKASQLGSLTDQIQRLRPVRTRQFGGIPCMPGRRRGAEDVGAITVAPDTFRPASLFATRRAMGGQQILRN